MWKIFEKKNLILTVIFFNFQRVTIIYLLVLCKPDLGAPIFLPFYEYQTRAPALLPKTIMPYVLPLYSPLPHYYQSCFWFLKLAVVKRYGNIEYNCLFI